MDETALELFAHTLLRKTGLYFDETKRSTLERVLDVRLKATAIGSVAKYCEFITSDQLEGKAEIKKLMQALTVNETYFFRNVPQWRALQEHVLPELLSLSTSKRRPLRVWSAGCSTGEEPYTLALILRAHFGNANTEILATDIDESALKVAIQGEYGARSVKKLDPHYLDTYFRVVGDRYILDESVRKMVDFRYLNLVDGDFPSITTDTRYLDLILCRNVIIYFAKDVSYQLLARFSECLDSAGYLVLGHAETQYRIPAFEIKQYDNAFLYRKVAEGATSKSRWRSDRSTPYPGLSKTTPSRKAATSTDRADSEVSATVSYDHLKLAEYYLSQNRANEALRELQKAIVQDPLLMRAYLLQGILLKTEGDLEQSMDHLKKALYLNPNSAIARYHLADSYRKTGDRSGAHREYRRLVALLESRANDEIVDDSGGMTSGMMAELCRATLDALEG